jgi:hypothetical protein
MTRVPKNHIILFFATKRSILLQNVPLLLLCSKKTVHPQNKEKYRARWRSRRRHCSKKIAIVAKFNIAGNLIGDLAGDLDTSPQTL